MGLFRRKKKNREEAAEATPTRAPEPAPRTDPEAGPETDPEARRPERAGGGGGEVGEPAPASDAPSEGKRAGGGSGFADEFTALADGAASDAGANNELWRRTFELEAWEFVPNIPPGETFEGMVGAGKPLGPLVATVEGAMYIMAFTSSERAFEFARSNGIGGADGISTLSMPVDGAVESVCAVTDPRITGVMFNRNKNSQAYFGSFNYLTAMYEMLRDRLPVALFDRFVQAVAESNSEFGWNRLHRRVALHDRWHHFADPATPDKPPLMAFSGQHVLLLFTDEDRLAKCKALLDQEAGGVDRPELSPAEASPRGLGEIMSEVQASAPPGTQVLVNMGSSSFRYEPAQIAHILAQRPG